MSRHPLARTRWQTCVLVALLPAVAVAVALFPVLAFASLIPILGFFALPSLMSLSIFLLYAYPATLYLFLSPTSPISISPYAHYQIHRASISFLYDAWTSRLSKLFLDALANRVLILGGRSRQKIVRENIKYSDYDPTLRLDVYLPPKGRSETDSPDLSHSPSYAPVIVFLGGGAYRFWRKSMGAQVALRLRRLGFVVVVPDVSQLGALDVDEGVKEMSGQVRSVLKWVEREIEHFGGDKDDLYLMGYGSGAHVCLLTAVQQAVISSRDISFKSSSVASIPPAIRDLTLPLDASRMIPRVKGMIFVSGVFDTIKQGRYEIERGIQDLSAMSKVCGKTALELYQSCPAHLLYGSKQVLDPTYLPPKVLIIAGGKDEQVPYSQSVLMKGLLVGAGVEMVRLRLYREMSHFGSLASLMHQTRYSGLVANEIASIVATDVL